MPASRVTRWLQRHRESEPSRCHPEMSTANQLFLAILVMSTSLLFARK